MNVPYEFPSWQDKHKTQANREHKKEKNTGKVVEWKHPSCSVTSIKGILSHLVDSNCPKLFGPCYSNVTFNEAHFIKADAGLLKDKHSLYGSA